MKVVEESPAPLTNAEVLSVLKERTASATPGTLQSETEVLKNLEARGTVTKTREEVTAFVAAIRADFNLNAQEILELINHAPTSELETFICLETAINEGRLADEDVARVITVISQHLK